MEADRQARFRRLWEEERARIAAYALRRTSVGVDAADVVAETFAIAWQRLDAVPEGSRARLWLYATARNVLSNQHRRRRRAAVLAERLGHELERSKSVEQPADAASLLARIAISSLRREDRELLMLVGWEGLDAEELGQMLGCSKVAARLRLHRARGALHGHLLVRGVDEKQRVGGQVPTEAVAE